MDIFDGRPDPLGFSKQDNEANFALFSSHAEKVVLGLFQDDNLIKEWPMKRSQDIWHIGIRDLPDHLEYAYRCEGPKKLLYKSDVWLIDPYAKIVRGNRALAHSPPPFDWQDDSPPQIPMEEMIIYEMHVRGLTKHASSKVTKPGTYLGVIEKIPYLKKLGINAVELMPIFGFDQNYTKRITPSKQGKLVNYWGYNPLHFFSPMNWYADSDPIFEFKTLVRELHKNGIEVILDVVYNHTGEENDLNYYVNFRGIDNHVYYMMGQDDYYRNYTGCWNTLNANHPMVQKLILDSLRYWVQDMHVDGFRFDLAAILTRGQNGEVQNNAPIIRAICTDPVLSKVKLIAEPWDAAGLYLLGEFAKWGSFSEWNDSYRDIVRRFIKGTDGQVGSFANVLTGSEMIYGSTKTPLKSINFITSHDGFTLRDLVTYQKKLNFENGENNEDGSDVNYNWNCGVEGPTNDPKIETLRERQMRNYLLALFVSQGIPMLLMGDEMGHTRYGNNNPYVQDNELNWFLWDQINEKIFNFVASLIEFRKKHPQLRHKEFLKDSEVSWFTNWDPKTRLIAYQLKKSPSIYIAFNANFQPAKIELPSGSWRIFINTAEDWQMGKNKDLISSIELTPYSACLAIQD